MATSSRAVQRLHALVAARQAKNILSWLITIKPVDTPYLRRVFDRVYKPTDFHLRAKTKGDEFETSKRITFDGVHLAYLHFHGRQPRLDEILEYLRNIGDHEEWGVIVQQRSLVPWTHEVNEALVKISGSGQAQ